MAAIRNVTVAGAGTMGSGIAQAFASGGFSVTLHDIDAAAIQRGLQRIRDPLLGRVSAGKMSMEDVDRIVGSIRPQVDLEAAAAGCDLFIEAVFEDLKVKRDLLARVDRAAPAATILATNTSSLYVRDLADATRRPDRVLGLHFFYPAAVNKLVEVVRGPNTSPGAIVNVHDAVRQAGKTPIEVADSPGFCVNRFFVPWLNEAVRLLEEGVADIPTIETAAKRAFGIGMGPFELMNVTGIPIALHAQETLHGELGAFYEPAKLLRQQVAAKRPWDLSGQPDLGKLPDAAGRLRGVALGIACHLVEDGIASIRDTDRGATVGLRWEKGPFAMMNDLGIERVATEVSALHERWKRAFPMPKTLEEHAREHKAWRLPAVTYRFEDDARVCLVTFDRPEALNALSPAVLQDLDACLDAIEKAGTVRAVVVTGEGKAFIAGADIPTMRSLDAAGARAYTEMGNRVISRMAALPCPVIVALNGFAFGGGLELALAGDVLVASEKAQMGLPEVGLGIHPGFGGTQRLPRRVGVGRAKDLVLTGRTVGAQEALQMGLVNAVVQPQQLLEHCMALARLIAQKAPLAVAGAKASIDQGFAMDLSSGLRLEQESVVLLFSTQDKKEGLDAFVEKRTPAFTGK